MTKKYVDSYQPGKWIPSCQLSADHERDSTEDKVVPFLLKLIGAKKPYNKFTIKLPSVRHSVEHLSTSSSASLPAKRSHTPPSTIGIFYVHEYMTTMHTQYVHSYPYIIVLMNMEVSL